GSLRGGNNSLGDRGFDDRGRSGFGSGGGRRFVHRGERILVFRLRPQDLNGGGFVGNGGAGVDDGGRCGRGADAFAARKARAADTGSGAPIGCERVGRAGGRGRGLGGRAAGRGCI